MTSSDDNRPNDNRPNDNPSRDDGERGVLVVGAGPAGAAAAIELARAGRRVTLIDKATFPRDKCCGDGLTTLALRQLDELGLAPTSVPSWRDVGEAWLRSPSGREVRLELPPDGRFAAITPRVELDAALVDLARSSGVDVRERRSFRSVDSGVDSVSIEVDGPDGIERLDASWVIAADGMWSPVRRAMGVADPGYLGEWHAFRQYVGRVEGSAADRLHVWFDADLLPGYAWSFPLPGGRVNFGFGVLRDGERRIQDMKEIWLGLFDRPHIREALGPNATPEGRHTAWPIPARIDEATTAVGRVLFVGDAAMATDALTGEGIGQALLTGREAARAIIVADSPVAVRNRYRAAVEHHLLADHRMSLRLSRVLAREKGARGAIALLDRAGRWGRTNFARWMFEDEPRAIAVTPGRWHRRLFRRSGAYLAGG